MVYHKYIYKKLAIVARMHVDLSWGYYRDSATAIVSKCEKIDGIYCYNSVTKPRSCLREKKI